MLENITQIWVQISESSFTNLTYQKEARVEVIIQWLTERHKWMETVFSDKKRFSLDSPDSWCTNSPMCRWMCFSMGNGYAKWLNKSQDYQKKP